MSDWQRNPGAIDDPGDGGEPIAAELDLPGPHDPVAWSYVQPSTPVVGREGVKLGTVEAMLGTEAEGIFHGIALHSVLGAPTRVIPADRVSQLTTAEVRVTVGADEVEGLQEYHDLG